MTAKVNGMRRLLKTGIAVGAHWTGLDRLVAARTGLDRAPLVLSYHRVVQDFEHSSSNCMPSMLVSTTTLEKQLEWVAERYRFVSLDELAGFPAVPKGDGGTSSDNRPVAVVTFDDGYQDVYQNAFPLLRRKGIPFTVYVVTDLVGTDRLQLHDELFLLMSAVVARNSAERAKCWQVLVECFGSDSTWATRLMRQVEDSQEPYQATRLMLHGLSALELRQALGVLRSSADLRADQRNGFLSMNWDMLREMHRDGVTVGSHTRSHSLLATEPEAVVREELEGSRRDLEQRLGVPIRHLAYPDGSFTEKTVRAVHAAGYLTATTICRHSSKEFPALTIPRRSLWEDSCKDGLGRFSPAILSCQVNGFFDSLERCPYEH